MRIIRVLLCVGLAACSHGNGGAGGDFTTVYSFKGNPDGQRPAADLINVGGTLYGTTTIGGANNDGTVFAVTTNGTETVLHSLAASADGSKPLAGLVAAGGALYGTTGYYGGPNAGGTVFKVTTGGALTVLHRFGAGRTGHYLLQS
jgi:uncharacterized repeat protein (TIGR03803 family)